MTNRQQRRRGDSNKPAKPGQKNWMLWAGAAVVVLAIAFVAFVAFGPESADDADKSALVSGGSVIGDPNARVTLVEFADFQ